MAVAVSLMLAWVPPSSVPVPTEEGVASVVWPLLPALLVLTLPPLLEFPGRYPERSGARSVEQLRALTVLATLSAGALVIICAPPSEAVVVLRNLLLLVGLVLALARLLPWGLAWVPVVFVPIVMWLYGTRQLHQVEPWAILLRPQDDGTALGIAIGTCAAGLVIYLWPGSGERPAPHRDRGCRGLTRR